MNITKPLTVMSLFDGMSCGYEALKRAGIPVKLYVASEIDPYAIKIAKKNHPEILHLGDVRVLRQLVEAGHFDKVDLLLGVSNTQRYKMLGNGWTVEIIVHLLRYMNA